MILNQDAQNFDVNLGANASKILKMSRPNGIAPTTEKEFYDFKKIAKEIF